MQHTNAQDYVHNIFCICCNFKFNSTTGERFNCIYILYVHSFGLLPSTVDDFKPLYFKCCSN